jgi:hypothetical protein
MESGLNRRRLLSNEAGFTNPLDFITVMSSSTNEDALIFV